MLANYLPTGDDYLRILPEIIMTAGATLILLIESLVGESKRIVFTLLSIGLFIAAMAAAIEAGSMPGLSFSNMLIVDGFATFFFS